MEISLGFGTGYGESQILKKKSFNVFQTQQEFRLRVYTMIALVQSEVLTWAEVWSM